MLAVAVVSLSGCTAAGQARWTMTDLGTLGSRADRIAVAINDRGQIIGNAGPSAPRAFLWQDGKITGLGTLGGTQSAATAINDHGQVIGSSTVKSGSRHAFLWQNGRMRDLGTLGGRQSAATAINDHGQVVGWSTTTSGAHHAFLWQNGRMRDLGTLGGNKSEANAINNHGQVVGWSTLKPGPDPNNPTQYPDPRRATHPFLWQTGRMTDLGTFRGLPISTAVAINERGDVIGTASWWSGGNLHESKAFSWQKGRLTALPTRGGDDTYAIAINNRGEIAGGSQDADTWSHPVLWRNGKLTDLGLIGTHAGDAFSGTGGASAINDIGQVVGEITKGQAGHAFVWQDGLMTDLGKLGGTESEAIAINEHGQVVGTNVPVGSQYTDYPCHAVLWSTS